MDIFHDIERLVAENAAADGAALVAAGFTFEFELNELSRNARYYRPEDLSEVRLARPVTVQELKVNWLGMMRRARTLVESLPEKEVGCLYLDAKGQVVTPDPGAAGFAGLTRHFGSWRGSWPRVVEE